MSQYRLKAQAFVGMQCETHTTQAGYFSFLYKEQEVERKAWEKHGGPQCWKAYLAGLKERFQKKSPGKLFPEPHLYSTGTTVTIMSLADFPTYDNEYEVRRTWVWQYRQVESMFPAKWIFTACRKALQGSGQGYFCGLYSGVQSYAEELRILRLAYPPPFPRRRLASLRFYPPRHETRLSSSQSVDNLREVLGRAPIPKHGRADIEGIDEIFDGCSDETWYVWNNTYLEPLYAALVDVIREHGTGLGGWSSARWEVYDKHCECMGGMHYIRERGDEWWSDGSKDWLYGKQEQKTGGETAQLYNSLLPRPPDGQRYEAY